MMKLLARLRRDEDGATAIEYGLIAALISVALIAGASTLGESLDEAFTSISGKMDEAGTKHMTPSTTP